jgi:hypothetical protein
MTVFYNSVSSVQSSQVFNFGRTGEGIVDSLTADAPFTNVNLSGVSSSSISSGAISETIDFTLEDVSSIAVTGVFSTNNFLNLSLNGVRSSCNIGSLDKSDSINLNGIMATTQVGIFDFTNTFPHDAIAPSLIDKIRKKKKKWKEKRPEVKFNKTPDRLYIKTVEKIKRPKFRLPQNDDDEDELEIILRTLL